MNARCLISMLAALASPALVSAQAPDGGPAGPAPHHHHEFGPSDGRPDGPQFGGEEHQHHHHHRMMHADGNGRADGQGGDPRERFMHVRAAIENLRAAGMNEEAQRVEMVARRMHEGLMQQEHGEHGEQGPGNHEGGPGMQGRHEHGNFGGGAPQGYDLHAQLEHLMRDVQELRAEVNQMRAGHRDGAGPQGNGPREFSQQPFGERHHGEHHEGMNPNQPPAGNARPPGGHPGGHPDGGNPPGPGPQPQANGPQGQQGGPFPRPEWRNHRGPNQNGGQPPAPPQGDRPPGPPANEPANEESLQDSAIEAPASTPGN